MKVDEQFTSLIDEFLKQSLSYNADAYTSIDEIKAKAIHIDDETVKKILQVN